MERLDRWRGQLVAFAVAWCVACGGPSFEGRVYRAEDMAFQIGAVPERWRSIEASPARIAFRDDARGATVAVGGRCGKDADDVPLTALTHHLFLHFTDRRIIEQRNLELDERGALRTELLAALDGVRKRFVVYVLKKDGCVYDFMYIGNPDDERDAIAEFDRFVRGFATLGTSS